ncbi:MAG: hypothetical protein ACLR3S_12850 [Clostridium fessum]
MPVSDKIIWKLEDGFGIEGRKEPEQLRMENVNRHPCDGADAPGIAAITAVQLWRWRQSCRSADAAGKDAGQQERGALVCPVCGQTEYPKISPAVIVAITNGNNLCRATASTTVPTVAMR